MEIFMANPSLFIIQLNYSFGLGAIIYVNKKMDRILTIGLEST